MFTTFATSLFAVNSCVILVNVLLTASVVPNKHVLMNIQSQIIINGDISCIGVYESNKYKFMNAYNLKYTK